MRRSSETRVSPRGAPFLGVALALAPALVGCGGDGESALDRALEDSESPTTSGPASSGDGDSDGSSDDSTSTDDETTTSGAPMAEWTVMVYVIGDNDLEPFALQDLLEMSAVGSTDEVNIVTLVDRHPGYSADPVGGLENFEDARLIFVGPGELTASEPLGEVNMGDPATLADFIEAGVTSLPAERYAVIIWDHGAGWPGMGPDETNGLDILDLAEIEQGFAEGLDRVGLDSIDLIGFDACLMATYEVASALDEHGDFMLASQELEPGHGWNYEALATLVDNPQSTPVDLGVSIIEGFAAQAESMGTNQEITLSLLDLTAMAGLQDALSRLAAPLAAEPQIAAPLLARAQAESLKFGAHPDPSLDYNMVDVGQVALTLGQSDPVLADPSIEVTTALDQLVVANVNGPATTDATGLSVYFPQFAEHFRQGYLFLDDVPVWQDLLVSYYTAGDAIPVEQQAEFVNVGGEADYFFDQDGLNIFGTFDIAAQGNLVEAEIFYGVLDENDGSIMFIGEEPAEVSTDGSGFAGAIYDLTVLTISDGIDTDFAYLDLTIDRENELLLIDVPLWYVPVDELETDDPPHDVILSLILDLEGNILSEIYYEIDELGAIAELIADPNGLIFPVVLNQYPDGSSEWLTLSEVGLFANLPDLQYALEPLDPGTGLYAELVLYDYGGNTDSISMFDLVP